MSCTSFLCVAFMGYWHLLLEADAHCLTEVIDSRYVAASWLVTFREWMQMRKKLHCVIYFDLKIAVKHVYLTLRRSRRVVARECVLSKYPIGRYYQCVFRAQNFFSRLWPSFRCFERIRSDETFSILLQKYVGNQCENSERALEWLVTKKVCTFTRGAYVIGLWRPRSDCISRMSLGTKIDWRVTHFKHRTVSQATPPVQLEYFHAGRCQRQSVMDVPWTSVATAIVSCESRLSSLKYYNYWIDSAISCIG